VRKTHLADEDGEQLSVNESIMSSMRGDNLLLAFGVGSFVCLFPSLDLALIFRDLSCRICERVVCV
jgi:hypothetical protein